MNEPKNGDIYLVHSNQIVIFHGNTGPRPDCGVENAICAVFGGIYSGKFGTSSAGVHREAILNDLSTYKYIGNLSTIFKEVLKL